jgi:membrane carboxypeptidase/penicillin-binding protein
VTLESLTSAYGVFASQGLHRTPTYIKRVEDQEGNVLYASPYESRQVISPQTSYLMTHMLADVINHGTAWKARQLGFKLPAAGKTGTTNDYHDVWFVGYTPRLVTGVWIGFDQPQTIIASGYAGDVAVPLWAAFMRKATDGDPAEWYKAPSGITAVNVCRLSGKRPADGCFNATVVNDDGEESNRSTVYTEYFVKGTEPDDSCALHSERSLVSRIAGWVGGAPAAPSQNRSTEAAADGPREAPAVDARRDDAPDEVRPAEPKKRGFWARVFGVGKKKGDKDEKK